MNLDVNKVLDKLALEIANEVKQRIILEEQVRSLKEQLENRQDDDLKDE